MTVRPIGDMLVNPEHVTWVGETLKEMGSARVQTLLADAQDAFASSDDFWGQSSRLRPYVVKDGVLTIPVQGMLLNDFPYAFGGWATGYEYITAAVQRGAADPMVRSIVLDVNSPGGTVTGCFDCADSIYEARGAKPIRAMIADHGYSAAYALASSADQIVMSRTGGVGSIGVISMHTDYSQMLENYGVKPTFIYAGEHKIDGRPELPLSKAAKAEFQMRIDASYDIFVATVARNRGLSEEAVRATEAATFLPRAAIEKGLADAVGSLGEIVSASADPSINDEDEEMSKDTNSTVELAVHESALAQARTEGVAEGKAEGAKLGAIAERERISAILASEEAKERPVAAMNLAMDTDMDKDKALAFLGKMPVETANGGTSFEQAMEQTPNPDLGFGTVAPAANASRADAIFASAGYGPAKK